MPKKKKKKKKAKQTGREPRNQDNATLTSTTPPINTICSTSSTDSTSTTSTTLNLRASSTSSTTASATTTSSTANSDGGIPASLLVAEKWKLKDDIENCKRIAPGGWLAFTIGQARWNPFCISRSIAAAFDVDQGTTEESVRDWLTAVEGSISHWVVSDVILSGDRVERFRSLGRGWILIQICRKRNKFKVWFESVERIIRRHQVDISRVPLTSDELRKHTYGYTLNTELIFFCKGLTHRATISIQKLHPDYHRLGEWAHSEADMRLCLDATLASDEDRRVKARRRLKKQRLKAKKKNGCFGSGGKGERDSGAVGRGIE